MFNWTEEAVALLGTMSDMKLSKQLKIPYSAVFKARTRRGIPSAIQRGDWSPANLALLGTMCDAALATQMGIVTSAVSQKRMKLGIACFGIPFKRVKVPSSIDADLGKLSDAVIAKKVGVSVTTIVKYRKRKGIETGYNVKGELPVEAHALLGTVTDIVIAERYGFSSSCISATRKRLGIKAVARKPEEFTRKKLPESITAQFGKVKDSELAKLAGVVTETVARQRRLLGIASVEDGLPPKLSDEALACLGKERDTVLAARYGVTNEVISKARKERGIPKFSVATETAKKYGHVLGTISDKRAARIIGVSMATIALARQSLGIAAYSEQGVRP